MFCKRSVLNTLVSPQGFLKTLVSSQGFHTNNKKSVKIPTAKNFSYKWEHGQPPILKKKKEEEKKKEKEGE